MTPVTGASPLTAPTRRFPPDPESVREARRFVFEVLLGVDPDVLDTAQLLVSELVTNAVLHAQTVVEVRLWADAARLHVRVTDRAPASSLLPRPVDPEASTGRGLQLVELLAARYGVDVLPDGKTVWFELWPGVSVEEVQDSRWQLPGRDNGEHTQIQLAEIPPALYWAGQRHRDALLRECRLHVLSHGDLFGLSAGTLVEAEGLHNLITEVVTDQLASLTSDEPATVTILVPPACVAAVVHLTDVLEIANERARAGDFLTRPALPEIRNFRAWVLSQISSQLAGAPPIAWQPDLQPAGRPGAAAVPWDVRVLESTDTGMLVASDENVIIAANEAACDLLGWTSAELVGQRIINIVPPELRQRHVIGFTNFLLTGESQIVGSPVQVQALHHDGHTLPVTLVIHVEQVPLGQAVFVAELTAATQPPAAR
jgi:PAS domain S-box-containing protein